MQKTFFSSKKKKGVSMVAPSSFTHLTLLGPISQIVATTSTLAMCFAAERTVKRQSFNSAALQPLWLKKNATGCFQFLPNPTSINTNALVASLLLKLNPPKSSKPRILSSPLSYWTASLMSISSKRRTQHLSLPWGRF
ncbi:uncharacterized protein LOC123317703 [Coccinella septempunctata]|uniref:uncharacterized protein LOC123317703 n=1 Tax=Coccinella septempunctata TaxID=41139 RepID=UPI001D061753|nr:uncharacterized protein LOC123317703 [Coccinella septempunctata]